ncbi:MAG: cation diffusion facilitator family transporter [Candidatus Bathyarchaeia archaeon]
MFHSRVGALRLSLALISTAVFVEGVAGLLTRSLALIADAAHASLDVLVTAMLLAAVTWSTRPPDRDHMYGHGKVESLGGLFGGLALTSFSALLVYRATGRLFSPVEVKPGLIGVGAALYTLFIDVMRIKALSRISESLAVRADRLHALSDFASTLIALVGLLLAHFKVYYGDPVASILLGGMLTCLSLRVIRDAFRDLSDRVSPAYVEAVKSVILGSNGVSRLRELRVRRVGDETFMDASIEVKGGQTVDQAHLIASQLEERLRRRFKDVSAVIHVEPSSEDVDLKELARNVCLSVEGVEDAHKITVTNVDSGSALSVHVLVNPKISLLEAHKIADSVENRLREEIPSLTETLIHIEPHERGVRTGGLTGEAEAERALREVMKQRKFRWIRSMKVLSVFNVEGKSVFLVKCKLDGGLSVYESHRLAERVKEAVQKAVPSAEVEVHTEPS